jgi:hypothetical protein
MTSGPVRREDQDDHRIDNPFMPLSRPYTKAAQALVEYVEQQENRFKLAVNRVLLWLPFYSPISRLAARIIYGAMPWLRSR